MNYKSIESAISSIPNKERMLLLFAIIYDIEHLKGWIRCETYIPKDTETEFITTDGKNIFVEKIVDEKFRDKIIAWTYPNELPKF